MSTITQSKIILSEIEKGDVFSESSHYVFERKEGNNYKFNHLESGKEVTLESSYVSELLQTADQYNSEFEVGKEDKLWTVKQIDEAVKAKKLKSDHNIRPGDVRIPGIRTIWNDIHSAKVFTVCYDKQSKEVSKKVYTEATQKQLEEALEKIQNAATQRKGVAKVAEEVIKEIQNNPVVKFQKGEERLLRGYKTQFESITGYYDVVDMDITTGSNKRQVNVNEIKWLVIDGTKYIVE